MLEEHPGVRVLRVSSLHETEPVDMEDPGAPGFLNGAVEIETELGPGELLAVLKRIERGMGREPGGVRTAVGGVPRYRSRTIDLDILLWGDRVVREADLAIPHPRMAERSFVLEPLAELCPDLVVPGYERTVRALCDRTRKGSRDLG